jgi:hypothetical protein
VIEVLDSRVVNVDGGGTGGTGDDGSGEDGSSDGSRLRFFARCRVVKGSETVGFPREEGRFAVQITGGKPGGSRFGLRREPQVSFQLKKKWNSVGGDKEH